ncbi:DUF6059 family protein [Streptomyces sp. NPDC049040]|uniref:DUF6059 family protein n=1 Tax=Streptomyces sp. NPDC049040 TaxID=3365593 RepID=UPI00371F908B
MRRLLHGRRQLLDRCLRPFLRSLTVLGVIHAGLAEHHVVLLAPASPPPFHALFGHGLAGPPPAHPERLCEDVPLSRQERRLAHEVWPAYYPERSAPGAG